MPLLQRLTDKLSFEQLSGPWQQKHRLKLLRVSISLLVLPLLFALLLSAATAILLQNSNLPAASRAARVANYPVRAYSAVSFNLLPCLESWKHGLFLASKSEKLLSQAVSATQPREDSLVDVAGLELVLEETNRHLQPLNENLQKRPLSWMLGKLGQGENLQLLDSAAKQALVAESALSELVATDQTWIVVLQNSDEIRATGGFAGSYLVAPILDGRVQEIIVEDIYDADGQFTGYLEPPPGVREYLSSNNGVRLPDANWAADFPQSATQMLQFFALGNRQNVSGLMVVSTPLVEDLLEVIGPVYIADFEATFDSSNFTELLRSERDTFFPGSVQKKHLISLLFNQLKLAAAELNGEDYQQLYKIMRRHVREKNLLAYSRKPELQESIVQLGLDGGLETHRANDFLFLVESNVGINKANKHVSRQVNVDLNKNNALVTINFQNDNLPPTPEELAAADDNRATHNGYINYQRLITLPHWQVESIKVGGERVEDFHLDQIENQRNQQFSQLGFLVRVKEQSRQTVEVEFSRTAPPAASDEPNSLTVLKQPGIEPYPFSVHKPGKSEAFILDSDKIISLESVTILP